MSRETRDSDYRPKRKILQKRRTPRRSRQLDSVKYSEYETESNTGSSSIISGEHTLVEDQVDSNSWTPDTFKKKVEETEEQYSDLAQQCRQQQSMAKQTESGIEKLLQMMMQMRQEDKIRDEQREKERLDREKRKEERWEREHREQREKTRRKKLDCYSS